jgi:hypothetical protein
MGGRTNPIAGYDGPPYGYEWMRLFVQDAVQLPAIDPSVGADTEPEEAKVARHPALARVPDDERILASFVSSPFGELVFTRANSSDQANKERLIAAGLAAYEAGTKLYAELLARAEQQKALVRPFQPYLEQPNDLIPILRDAYQNPRLKGKVDETAKKLTVTQAEVASQQQDMIKDINDKINLAIVVRETQHQAMYDAMKQLEIQDTEHKLEEYKDKLEAEEKRRDAEWEYLEGATETAIGAVSEHPIHGIAGLFKVVKAFNDTIHAGDKDSGLEELLKKVTELKFDRVAAAISKAIEAMDEIRKLVKDMQTRSEQGHSKFNELMGKAEDWFDTDCSSSGHDGCGFEFKSLRSTIGSATDTGNQARKFSDALQRNGSLGGPIDQMVFMLRELNESEMRTLSHDLAGWFELTKELEETEAQLILLRQTADTALAQAPGV